MKPRVRVDVTRGEYVWTMVAVFLMGSLFGWGALGLHPFPASALDKSSTADILAALGTWIVGVMAWRIASQSHQHQKDIRRDADVREMERAIRELQALLNEVITVSSYAATAHDVMKSNDLSIESIEAVLTTSESATGANVLPPSAVPILGEATMKSVDRLKFQQMLFGQAIKGTRSVINALAEDFQFDADEHWVASFKTRTERFHESAEECEQAIRDEIAQRKRALTQLALQT